MYFELFNNHYTINVISEKAKTVLFQHRWNEIYDWFYVCEYDIKSGGNPFILQLITRAAKRVTILHATNEDAKVKCFLYHSNYHIHQRPGELQ